MKLVFLYLAKIYERNWTIDLPHSYLFNRLRSFHSYMYFDINLFEPIVGLNLLKIDNILDAITPYHLDNCLNFKFIYIIQKYYLNNLNDT